jgi:branched-chain amino acid transport system substrate-binding protein
MRPTSLAGVLVLALAAAAIVVPAGSAGAAQPTGSPITIGYIQEQQAGPSQIDEEPVLAAWAKWVNAQGGINGHPVQVTLDVEPNNVAVAVTDAQKFVSEGVDAIVDADANDTAWAQYPENAGIPVFLSTDTTAFGSSDDSFGIPQNPIVQASEEMIAAKSAGATKLAILYCTEFSQCSQAVPFYEAEAKKYGVQDVYNAAVSGSAPNYLAQCLAAKADGASSLFVASTSATSLRVVADCAKQGYNPHLIAGSGSYQKSTAGTPGTNGLLAPVANVPFFDTSNPAINQMTSELNKYNSSITKSPYYDDTSVWNWSDGVIIDQALKAAKITPTESVTPAMLRDALFALHTTNAGGLILPITMTKGQPETNQCFYLAGIKNNKFDLPHGLKETCVAAS